jgi:hypothetical protein
VIDFFEHYLNFFSPPKKINHLMDDDSISTSDLMTEMSYFLAQKN